LLPTLELDDGTRLAQSLAIIEWLEDKHPSPPLMPKDPLARARVRSLSYLIACEIHPLNNLRVLQHLKRALGQTQEQIDAWYRHWIADGLAKLEADLTRGESGRFCHGEAPTLADCCLVPQIFNAKRYNSDLTPFPTTMPVFGYDEVQPSDADLTKQHKGEPLGERIVVSGRVLDENGKPVPSILVEIWQANAAGRYNHRVDQHDAPIDPNFTGAGRFFTDK